jgi:glucose/arabinose dehydrogenase
MKGFSCAKWILIIGIVALVGGCKLAPLQVVPQPRTVEAPPPELPRIPSPDPAAAHVPAGYKVEVVVRDLTYPSSVEFDNEGRMFVAESGYVYGDEAAPARVLRIGGANDIEVVADQLNGPVTDLLWHNDELFISHKGKISVLRGGKVVDIVTALPSEGDHHNNQLTAGPDGKIYVGQGAVSNSGVVGVDNFVFGWLGKYPKLHDVPAQPIEVREKRFASLNPLKLSTEQAGLLANTGPFQGFGDSGKNEIPASEKPSSAIFRFNPDGSQFEVYAWGIRNPFGLAWGPDGKLYATDNGYDERGSRPIANAPDSIWVIRQGGWYGFPDFAGGIPITDRRFNPEKAAAPAFLLKNHPPVEQPLVNLPPHVAVCKIDFSPSSQFGYEGQMFAAQVGDMQPVTGNEPGRAGFQVIRVDPQSGKTEPFFRAKPETLGARNTEYVTTPGPKRPVDVRFSKAENAMYVVDIGAIMVYPTATPLPHPFPGSGVIWRITKEGSQPKVPANISLLPGGAQPRLTPTGRENPERGEQEPPAKSTEDTSTDEKQKSDLAPPRGEQRGDN